MQQSSEQLSSLPSMLAATEELSTVRSNRYCSFSNSRSPPSSILLPNLYRFLRHNVVHHPVQCTPRCHACCDCAFAPSISAESFAGTIIYTGKDCSGTPLVVSVIGSVDCEAVECVLFIADSVTYSSETICERADRQAYVASTFAGSSYVLVETYSKMCTYFLGLWRFWQRVSARFMMIKVPTTSSPR
ncbi:hypothetical protein GQ600_2546 [Phytophthora cactorum]|nr:hypothetical protein GQ600_2546 [Phytophthora cactorum]